VSATVERFVIVTTFEGEQPVNTSATERSMARD
jgi:hypothetical protein